MVPAGAKIRKRLAVLKSKQEVRIAVYKYWLDMKLYLFGVKKIWSKRSRPYSTWFSHPAQNTKWKRKIKRRLTKQKKSRDKVGGQLAGRVKD